MDLTPAAGPRPARRRGPLDRLAAAAGWSVVVALAATLVFSYALPQRLTDHGGRYDHMATAAFFGRVFTFHAGLLIVTVGGLAAWRRRWRLAALSAAVAAAALWPTALACLPHHPPVATSLAVRLMAMNVKYSNTDLVDIVGQVRRANPDVLTVEELGTPCGRALEAALAADYPYRCQRTTDSVGLALYSRLPFDGSPATVSVGRYVKQIRAVVRVGDRRVAVYVLHPLSPRSAGRVILNRLATADLVQRLGRETLPVVLAGDFNFTAETPNAAALTGTGLTDAFDLAGWGRGSTWPAKPPWVRLFPGVRIDHVYLSPGLTCTRYATGGFTGSDHLPIVADLATAAPR